LVFNFVKAFTVDFFFWISCSLHYIYGLGDENVQFYSVPQKKSSILYLDYPFSLTLFIILILMSQLFGLLLFQNVYQKNEENTKIKD
jgi:hypothetical protein